MLPTSALCFLCSMIWAGLLTNCATVERSGCVKSFELRLSWKSFWEQGAAVKQQLTGFLCLWFCTSSFYSNSFNTFTITHLTPYSREGRSVCLNIIMAIIIVKMINEKRLEDLPSEQLEKLEVVCVSAMGSAACGYHRPQSLSPAKTNFFTQGYVTAASLK